MKLCTVATLWFDILGGGSLCLVGCSYDVRVGSKLEVS